MEAGGEFRGWRRVGILRPLEIRDFRLLWTGLSISLLGDGLNAVALIWLVLELSNSPTAVALVGVAWTVPLVVFLLLGGVISDRFDRRKVMVTADTIRLVASATLGVLSVTGQIELWQVFVLAAVYGTGEALFYPALGALIPEVVPRDLLVQANALDGFVRPLASRLIGPALGGVAIEYLSVGGALLLDAGSFVFSITALLLMRPRPRERGEISARHVLADLREGFAFVRAHTWLWGTLRRRRGRPARVHWSVGGVAAIPRAERARGSAPESSASSTRPAAPVRSSPRWRWDSDSSPAA